MDKLTLVCKFWSHTEGFGHSWSHKTRTSTLKARLVKRGTLKVSDSLGQASPYWDTQSVDTTGSCTGD